MISCDQAHIFFDEYLNDELSSAMTAELDAHLLECPTCRHHLCLMEACGNVIRLDTSEPQISENFTDRLMNIIEQGSASKRPLQITRGMKIAGGLLGMAATITLFVLLDAPRSPKQDPAIINAPSGPVLASQDVGAGILSDSPAADETAVAGVKVGAHVVPQMADVLASGPDGVSRFDALEQFASMVEILEATMRKLAESNADPSGALDHYLDAPPDVPVEPAELDVTGTLPDLGSDGEDL